MHKHLPEILLQVALRACIALWWNWYRGDTIFYWKLQPVNCIWRDHWTWNYNIFHVWFTRQPIKRAVQSVAKTYQITKLNSSLSAADNLRWRVSEGSFQKIKQQKIETTRFDFLQCRALRWLKLDEDIWVLGNGEKGRWSNPSLTPINCQRDEN